MEITLNCPSCGKSYSLAATLAGKKARCTQCASQFIIPFPQPEAELEAEQDAFGVEPAKLLRKPGTMPEIQSGATEKPSRQASSLGIRALGGALVGVVLAVLLGLLTSIRRPHVVVESVIDKAATVPVEPVAQPPVAIKVDPVKNEPAAATAARPLSTADIVAKCEPSVALIKGKRGSGTGFLVRPGILATNAHVIEDETIAALEIRFPSADQSRQGPLNARLLYQDTTKDLAFLAVATTLPPLPIAESYVFRKGEDVTIIGNPGIGAQVVLENTISRGIVGSRTRLNGRDLLQLSVAINPGNSGGPVLDATGKVIGVATLKATRQEGVAFCVPAAELSANLLIAESRIPSPNLREVVTAAPIKPMAVVAKGSAPDLNYGWKTGETYVYDVDLSIEIGTGVIAFQGTSIYRVKAVEDDEITIGYRGWLVTRRRGKDGILVSGGTSGPSGGDREVELRIDRKGNVVTSQGSSPVPLLGDMSMLVIDPFPDDAQPAWEDAHDITLAEIEAVPGAGGGSLRLGRPSLNGLPRGAAGSRLSARSRSRLGQRGRQITTPAPAPPQVNVTNHPAQEQTHYSLGTPKGDTIVIIKKYELTTQEIVDAEPRLKITGEGTADFDLKTGLPQTVNFRAKLVETTANITVRVPIVLNCRLLSGTERIKAMRYPVMDATAMNPLDEATLKRAISDLNSTDANRIRPACQLLFDAAPIDARRGDVSRALERALTASGNDPGFQTDVIRTLGLWGDSESANFLLAKLGDNAFKAREALFQALGRLEPSAPIAEKVAGNLGKNGPEKDWAARTLKAIGSLAEQPLLQVVNDNQKSNQERAEACRVLKEIGGPSCIPTLQAIVGLKDGAEVGRAAGDAVRDIMKRSPTPDEFAAILFDLKSPDTGRRRSAAERLSVITVIENRRGEIARLLETLATDADGGVQEMAYRALGNWADDSTLGFLINRLNEPDKLLSPRAAVELMKQLAPADDPRAAEAIAHAFKKERWLASDLLRAMGPAAERGLLNALASEPDGPTRDEYCKLLAQVGSSASLTALGKIAQSELNPSLKNSAKRAIEEITKRGDFSVEAIVISLKASDHQRVKHAVESLANRPRGKTPQPQITHALELLIDDTDIFMRNALLKAFAIWGDDKTADLLLTKLDRKESKDWRETAQALINLRPDERTLSSIVARIGEDPGLIERLFKSVRSRPEPLLIAVVKSSEPKNTRVEACRLLGKFGTPQSIPDLKQLAAQANAEELGRVAEDALKTITARK